MESSARLDARYEKWRTMGNVGIAEADSAVCGSPCSAMTPRSRRWSQELGISPVTARLLCIRGISAISIRLAGSCHPSLDDLLDPFALTDMAVAVDRILGAIASRRAHRHPRRLRRRRRHVDGHPAPRARAARRRRHRTSSPSGCGTAMACSRRRSIACSREACSSSSRSTAASAASKRRCTRARARARSDHHGSPRARHRACQRRWP